MSILLEMLTEHRIILRRDLVFNYATLFVIGFIVGFWVTR